MENINKEQSLVNRTLDYIKKRRTVLLEGGINSIPSPFKRFSEDLLGVEQATYYCVTSYTKGGKSQFATNFFICEPLEFAYNNPDKVEIDILYFVLEETPERVLQRYMSYLLFKLSGGKIRISPKQLRSSNNDKPLSQEIINILESEEYQKRLNFFEKHVKFSSTENPTGILRECEAYAKENGVTHYKAPITNNKGEILDKIFDYYQPHNPNKYTIVFIDHIGMINTEKGMTMKQSMDKLSEYLAKYIRNRYYFSPVVIQQQSLSICIFKFEIHK